MIVSDEMAIMNVWPVTKLKFYPEFSWEGGGACENYKGIIYVVY
jgi:hypothetical protein